MKVTGADLSLTSTGLAHIYTACPEVSAVTERVRPAASLGTGHLRLAYLLSEIGAHTRTSDLVVIEGPSYGSPNAQHKLGGLWWLVAHGLWRRGTPYVVVQPGSRATYATGRGNAGKDEVLLAVARRYPAAEVAGNDEADALVLAAMAADYLGFALAVVPESHRRALASVQWPGAVQEWRRVATDAESAVS